ncbi:MAG: HTH-type transcriptional regulator CysB [Thiohalomonadaceae bacterium]
MTLQQLRCVLEVVRQQLNITAAARALHTSQPGVSRHIRMLEEELGVRIFGRSGASLTHVTREGAAIVQLAEDMLAKAEKIRAVAADFRDPGTGTLTIGTTHTQARYVLPPVVSRFAARYPRVRLCLHQGTPRRVAEMAHQGEVDLVIATEAINEFDDLLALPCYAWDHCVVVPRNHPLCEQARPGLETLVRYPIVTYTSGFTGRAHLDEVFASAGLIPNVVFTASDADVIKTYVRRGMGIGIVAAMAIDPVLDRDLCAIDASHLFPSNITRIGLRRDAFLRKYGYDFIEGFASHLKREAVMAAAELEDRAAVDALFAPIPHYGSSREGTMARRSRSR